MNWGLYLVAIPVFCLVVFYVFTRLREDACQCQQDDCTCEAGKGKNQEKSEDTAEK